MKLKKTTMSLQDEKRKNQDETREDFCGACVAIPAAIVGASGAGLSSKAGSHSTMKKVMLWGGIGLTVLSAGIAIYFLTRCKECQAAKGRSKR
jgi:uncharacterized membrane protein YjfL (UPF0719 family)